MRANQAAEPTRRTRRVCNDNATAATYPSIYIYDATVILMMMKYATNESRRFVLEHVPRSSSHARTRFTNINNNKMTRLQPKQK